MLIPSTWTHRLTRAYTSTLNTSQVFHKHNSAVLFGKSNCSVVGYFRTATKPRLRAASWSIIAPPSTITRSCARRVHPHGTECVARGDRAQRLVLCVL